MPGFTVHRTIQIQAGLDAIYPHIRDFKQWKVWSPWLLAEPDCPIEYGSDGRSYAWKGKIVGAGKMELLSEEGRERLHYRLTFLEPWKSVNTTAFEFTAANGGIRLEWTMEGTLPWLMFWMKTMMSNFVGMDYDRGLRMLKDLSESGTIPSTLDFMGRQMMPAIQYFGLRQTCPMARIGEEMSATFKRIEGILKETGIECAAPLRALYHKWAISKGMTEFTVACPIATMPTNLPANFITGEMPAHAAYVIQHTGAYRHLGNAWAAGMMRGRNQMFAQDKKAPPFEIYDSDPQEIDESNLVTRVCFPVKS